MASTIGPAAVAVVRETLDDQVAESATAFLNSTTDDSNGDAVQPDTATLIIHDERSGTEMLASTNILSSVTAGVVDYAIPAAANAMANANLEVEQRICTLEWTFDSGKAGKKEIAYFVKNLLQV